MSKREQWSSPTATVVSTAAQAEAKAIIVGPEFGSSGPSGPN